MTGLLTKLSSTTNALRTPDVIGDFPNPPKVRESFIMFAIPLDTESDLRVVTTSQVLEVEEFDDYYLFTTLNSQYRLDVYE